MATSLSIVNKSHKLIASCLWQSGPNQIDNLVENRQIGPHILGLVQILHCRPGKPATGSAASLTPPLARRVHLCQSTRLYGFALGASIEMMFLAESGLVQEVQSSCLGALAIYHFGQLHHRGVVLRALQPNRFDVHFKRKVAVAGPEEFHAEFVASVEGQMYLRPDVRCKIRRAAWKKLWHFKLWQTSYG